MSECTVQRLNKLCLYVISSQYRNTLLFYAPLFPLKCKKLTNNDGLKGFIWDTVLILCYFPFGFRYPLGPIEFDVLLVYSTVHDSWDSPCYRSQRKEER